MFCKISFLLVLVAVCLGSPTGSTEKQFTIQPEKDIRNVGEPLQILCTWPNEPLSQCIFKIPEEGNQYKRIQLDKGSKNKNTSIEYFGTGLQNGECGLKMTVEEKHHSAFTCELTSKSTGYTREATMALTVTIMPKDPVLDLIPAAAVEGSEVAATCIVYNGRPAAKIYWEFDGKTYSPSNERYLPGEGKGTLTVKSVAKLKVTAEDDQKYLTCTAQHHSWHQEKIASKLLTVNYKPRFFNEKNEKQTEIHYSKLELGKKASLVVKLKSNPAPTGAEVTIGKTTLAAEQDDGKNVLSMLKPENGYYVYSLTIRNFTEEILHEGSTLKVNNTAGSSMARLTFSLLRTPDTTSTEKPKERAVAGSTMTGVIIGVSVLVIILIGVLMFAKFNKKWCFRREPPVHTGQLVSNE